MQDINTIQDYEIYLNDILEDYTSKIDSTNHSNQYKEVLNTTERKTNKLLDIFGDDFKKEIEELKKKANSLKDEYIKEIYQLYKYYNDEIKIDINKYDFLKICIATLEELEFSNNVENNPSNLSEKKNKIEKKLKEFYELGIIIECKYRLPKTKKEIFNIYANEIKVYQLDIDDYDNLRKSLFSIFNDTNKSRDYSKKTYMKKGKKIKHKELIEKINSNEIKLPHIKL